MLEYTARMELSLYGWQHPLSVTNYEATDPLYHALEPFSLEDRVSLNTGAIRATSNYTAGHFLSYHA